MAVQARDIREVRDLVGGVDLEFDRDVGMGPAHREMRVNAVNDEFGPEPQVAAVGPELAIAGDAVDQELPGVHRRRGGHGVGGIGWGGGDRMVVGEDPDTGRADD